MGSTKTQPKKPSTSILSKKTPTPTFKHPKNPEKQMKPIFKHLVMSLSGTFISCDKTLPHDKIAGWITCHGGSFERQVTDDTTHLICSIEDYKKGVAQVQKAWKLGPKCKIVVFDWLEDCLVGPKMTKRLRAERGYTLDRTIKRINQGKKDHVAFRQKFEDGVRYSEELCDSKLHHIYYDPDGFEYKIVLTRVNLDGKALTEKYTIFLFRSHARPHHYRVGAKLSRFHRPTAYYKEYMGPRDFPTAFSDFKYLFHNWTGIEWDMRLEGIRKGPEKFRYEPPVLGRPVGRVGLGYVRPEFREGGRGNRGSKGEGEGSCTMKGEGENSGESGRESGSGGEVGCSSGTENVYDTDSEVDDVESKVYDEVATGKWEEAVVRNIDRSGN